MTMSEREFGWRLATSDDVSTEVDTLSRTEWNSICLWFRDATLSQTWAFGTVQSGKHNLSHIVVKRDEYVLAAAQVRILTLPFLKAGIAYVRGPMWKRPGSDDSLDSLRLLLRALRNEYALNRRLQLRVLPNVFDNDTDAEAVRSIFEEAGFGRRESPHQTLFLELKPPLEELRRALHQKWRNHLVQAEKRDMSIIEGDDDVLFRKFIGLYREMYARKRYPPDIDIARYAAIQRDLPANLKPRIVLCELGGHLMAGRVFSTIGTTAISLLSATADEGLRTRASYLVTWRTIQWLKQRGYARYDLGGVDPDKTPGTYRYKAGVCGKKPRVCARIGDFISCESQMSTLAVGSGELFKSMHRRARGTIASIRKYIDSQRG